MTLSSDILELQIPLQDSFPTRAAAVAAGAVGADAVCSLCGRWGAFWVTMRVPQYVRRALCSDHAVQMREEVKSLMEHMRRVSELQEIRFHQPPQAAT